MRPSNNFSNVESSNKFNLDVFFACFGLDNDVIHLNFYTLAYEALKYLIHAPLIRRSCIFEVERYDLVKEVSLVRHERHIFFISMMYPYLVVT